MLAYINTIHPRGQKNTTLPTRSQLNFRHLCSKSLPWGQNPARFDGYKSSESGDRMYFICHVISHVLSQNHEMKESYDFMGESY